MAKQWYEAVHPVFAGTTPPTNKRFRFGSRRTSMDGSVWMYAKGVASNTVGAWVVFQDNTYIPVLTTGALPGPIAVSAAANTSATSGSWYMVHGATKNNNLKGLVVLETDASGTKKAIYQTATAGQGSTTTVAGTKIIFGAIADGNPAATLGDVILNFPFSEGTSTL